MGIADDYIQRNEDKKRLYGILYVTDITKECLLNAYHSIIDPKPYSLKTLRIFETGKIIEDWYIKVLRSTPEIMVVLTQHQCYYKNDDIEIHGRLDALCQHNFSSLVIHEIKSAKDAYKLTQPREQHRLQLQFYLNALNVSFGRIDYIDKDLLIHGENDTGLYSVDNIFTIEKQPATFVYLIKRAKELDKAIKNKTPPLSEPCWLCNEYCEYKNKCKANNNTN